MRQTYFTEKGTQFYSFWLYLRRVNFLKCLDLGIIHTATIGLKGLDMIYHLVYKQNTEFYNPTQALTWSQLNCRRYITSICSTISHYGAAKDQTNQEVRTLTSLNQTDTSGIYHVIISPSTLTTLTLSSKYIKI